MPPSLLRPRCTIAKQLRLLVTRLLASFLSGPSLRTRVLAVLVTARVIPGSISLLEKTIPMPPVPMKLLTLVTCVGLGLELVLTFLTLIRPRLQVL